MFTNAIDSDWRPAKPEPVPRPRLPLHRLSADQIDSDGVRSVTPNPVTRCSGLAVSGAELAFLDQHRAGGGFRWEIRRARREGRVVTESDRVNLLLPHDRLGTGEDRQRWDAVAVRGRRPAMR